MIRQRKIGPYTVSAMGLGCMPLSFNRPGRPIPLHTRAAALAVLHAAMDAGITLFDTADIYGPSWNQMGHNELLLGEALRTWRGDSIQKARIVLATKAGITREKDGTDFGCSGRNSSRHYLFRAVEASACRLGVARIPLWQHHRTDPSLSFERQFENVLALKEHGYVAEIGLSNVNSEMLRYALRAGGKPGEGGVISVQNEYSPRYRHWGEVPQICSENGIAFLPWSPFGGSGHHSGIASGKIGVFRDLAREKGVSPYALVIAWHLHRYPVSIPIPGATKVASVLDNLQGVNLDLSQEEIKKLDQSCPTDTPLHPELLCVAAMESS